MNLILLFVVACVGNGKVDDSGVDSLNPTCDTTHEECAPGVRNCGGEAVNMLPGSDCIACHTRGGADEAPNWTAAGTIFDGLDGSAGVAGAKITVTDSTGASVQMTSSSAGNFYTNQALVPPLIATVETDNGILEMRTSVATGACNSCHQCSGTPGGKLYAP